jgi:hypothetical protein
MNPSLSGRTGRHLIGGDRRRFPLVAHFLPPHCFLTLRLLGRQAAFQPEIEPGHIAPVSRELVSRLTLEMEFAREDVEVGWDTRLPQRGMAGHGCQVLIVGRLKEQRKPDILRFSPERYLLPDRCVALGHFRPPRLMIPLRDHRSHEGVLRGIEAAAAQRACRENRAVLGGKLNGEGSGTQACDADTMPVDQTVLDQVRDLALDRRENVSRTRQLALVGMLQRCRALSGTDYGPGISDIGNQNEVTAVSKRLDRHFVACAAPQEPLRAVLNDDERVPLCRGVSHRINQVSIERNPGTIAPVAAFDAPKRQRGKFRVRIEQHPRGVGTEAECDEAPRLC